MDGTGLETSDPQLVELTAALDHVRLIFEIPGVAARRVIRESLQWTRFDKAR